MLRRRTSPSNWVEVAAGPRRARATRRHPQTTDRLRTQLARRSLLELILFFAAVLGAGGLLGGVAFVLTAGPHPTRGFLHAWLAAYSILTSIPFADALPVNGSRGRQITNSFLTFGGVVIPALFLGALIFKLFVAPQVFVFRNEVAILPNDTGAGTFSHPGRHLAVKLYSATRLRLINVRCEAHLHADRSAPGHGRSAHYFPLEVANPCWPLAHTHIPYTVRIPLQDDDVSGTGADMRLRAVQGLSCGHADDFLMLTLTARAPELGTEFAETYVYDVPAEVRPSPPGPITYLPGAASRKWRGWDRFDAGPSEP